MLTGAATKTEYDLSINIKREPNQIFIALEKAPFLKSGGFGRRTIVSKAFLKQNFGNLTERKKIVLSLMLNESNDSNYYNYHANDKVIKIGKFDNAADIELLNSLRTLHEEEPAFFANCHFPKENALPQIYFEEKDNKNHYAFKIAARLNETQFNLNDKETTIIGNDPLWACAEKKSSDPKFDKETTCFELQTEKPIMLKKLLRHQGTEIKASEMNNFIEKYYASLCKASEVILPHEYKVEEISDVLPKPRIFLKNHQNSFCLELRFLYLNNEVAYNNNQDPLFRDKNNKLARIKRNKNAEKEFYCALSENCVLEKNSVIVPTIEPLSWLTETAPRLISKGFEIFGQEELVNYKINRAIPRLDVKVSSGIDWFDLKAEADFGGEKIAFSNIADAMNKNERFIKLSDGSIGVIPEKWLSKLGGISGFLQKNKKEDTLIATNTQIPLVEAMLDIADKTEFDQNFEKIREKFKRFNGIKKASLPEKLKAQLRDYQIAGYN